MELCKGIKKLRLPAYMYTYMYVKNGKVICKKNYFTLEQLLRTEDDVDKLLYHATTFMH